MSSEAFNVPSSWKSQLVQPVKSRAVRRLYVVSEGMRIVPALPQDVMAAWMAGVSSCWVSPRLAGVQVARFARTARFGVSVSVGAVKTLVAKRSKVRIGKIMVFDIQAMNCG